MKKTFNLEFDGSIFIISAFSYVRALDYTHWIKGDISLGDKVYLLDYSLLCAYGKVPLHELDSNLLFFIENMIKDFIIGMKAGVI